MPAKIVPHPVAVLAQRLNDNRKARDEQSLRSIVNLAADSRSPEDAAGLLVAAALCILIEHKHTPGDAARLVVTGVQRGLKSIDERVRRIVEELAIASGKDTK